MSRLTAQTTRVLDRWIAPAGIQLNGPNPWDPIIHHPRAIWRTVIGGTRGAGEAYVDGEWDCAALDEFTARVCASPIDTPLRTGSLFDTLNEWRGRLTRRQTRLRSRASIASHYDIGDDLYTRMLGETMAYSCGYWDEARSLDEAQRAKFALICRKLRLERGQRLLDIGCGWGGLAAYAAAEYGVEAVGITISPAQAAGARARAKGLPVEIRQQDYRDLSDRFDRVVSVGMLEHVGPGNYRRFFEVVRRQLAPGGLALVHTIGGQRSLHAIDGWMDRYIFPGAVLPSATQLTRAFEGLFVLEDWHNFGADYDRTLMAWHANVEAAWPDLAEQYPERFRRLWRYYLLTCAGTFRARQNQLWQIVLSPRGVRGGYRRVS